MFHYRQDKKNSSDICVFIVEYFRLKWYWTAIITDIATKENIPAGHEIMPVYCSNHPRLNAVFTCPKCHANLCPSCIAVRKHEYFGHTRDVYLCSECNIFLEKLPLMTAFEPFWMRLPSFLAYPLQIQPALLAVVLALVQSFFTDGALPDLLVHFLSFAVLLAYASLVMSATANGRLTQPVINRQSVQKITNFALQQIVLFLAVGAFFYKLLPVILEYFGLQPTSLTVIICAAVLFLIMPAIIIMLMVTGSFFASLLPNIISRLAWRIGWPYPAMCFFLFIFLLIPSAFIRVIWDTLPLAAGHLIAALFACYYLITSYHLLGYFLFQYQEKAGYKVDFESVFHQNSVSSSKEPAQDMAVGEPSAIPSLIENGAYQEALMEIRKASGGPVTDPVLAGQYYDILDLTESNADQADFLPHYIKIMDRAGRKDRLVAACLKAEKINPGALDNDPALLLSAGKTLLEGGHPIAALKIYDKFIELYRDHPMTPDAFFMMARIFNEHLDKADRAVKIIEGLLKKYPFHENTQFVRAYVRKIRL